MKYNIRKYILAGITAILAAAGFAECGGSKPEKDDTVKSTQEYLQWIHICRLLHMAAIQRKQ